MFAVNYERIPPMKHGTTGAYTNHRCRCKECKKAWRLYFNKRYRYDAAFRENRKRRSREYYWQNRGKILAKRKEQRA
jgi:hypothetical protein